MHQLLGVSGNVLKPCQTLSLSFLEYMPQVLTSRVSSRLETEQQCFRSVQSFSRVRLFATPWTAARQASLSITNSQSLLKLMSIQSVMPSNLLILCRLLLPSGFPSVRVFSNESVLPIRWPKDWSFSFRISPTNEVQQCLSVYTNKFLVELLTYINTVASLDPMNLGL